MLKGDCRAAAMDIALALGDPLHRMGRARKRGFSLHSIFAKLFAFESSKQFKKQMLGQKGDFAQRQSDILRLCKLLLGPIGISNYPLLAMSGK